MKRALADELPDLVLLVRRDGVLLESTGGRAVSGLLTRPGAGQRLDASCPEGVAVLLHRLTRAAIATRAATDGHVDNNGVTYEVRATPQGPDRALCVIRPSPVGAPSSLDRRGFLRRFKDALSAAALREAPMAVSIICIEGVTDISRALDASLSEQVFGAALHRLRLDCDASQSDLPPPIIGPLNDNTVAMTIETADRDAVMACVARVCASIAAPLTVGDATFHLTPYAGVAVLGQDAGSAATLLDHARSAASEARRSGTAKVSFFSDTLTIRSLARLDMTRELREAIADGHIRLRYVGRHDLATGHRVARVGYLQWIHPLRGEIRPEEFVRVAAATGLARELSLSVLRGLPGDFQRMNAVEDSHVVLSFGALRHHILHAECVSDIARLLGDSGLPVERLELRIAERSLIAADIDALRALRGLGVALVVDEVGRGLSSLERLAAASLRGLQLDRTWAESVRRDAVALQVCRATLQLAIALGLTPMAAGIDDEAQRQAFIDLGCMQGSGDLYGDCGAE